MTSISVSLNQTVFKISWSGFIRSIHHFHIHQNAPYLITYQILRHWFPIQSHWFPILRQLFPIQSRVLQSSQEKLKDIVMQNFGGAL